MCFSSRVHTFLHRATLASHFMVSRISPSSGEVLRAGSESPQQAPQARPCFLAKKMQTLQKPGKLQQTCIILMPTEKIWKEKFGVQKGFTIAFTEQE